MTLPRLLWDWGTAYDLFVSLDVLHDPTYFGVRGSWAAGVRARLPAAVRERRQPATREGRTAGFQQVMRRMRGICAE